MTLTVKCENYDKRRNIRGMLLRRHASYVHSGNSNVLLNISLL